MLVRVVAIAGATTCWWCVSHPDWGTHRRAVSAQGAVASIWRLLRVYKRWNTLVVEDSARKDGDAVSIGGKEIKLSKKANRVGSFRENYELIVKSALEGLFAPVTLRLRILETGSEYLMNFREGKVLSISTKLVRCANGSEGR